MNGVEYKDQTITDFGAQRLKMVHAISEIQKRWRGQLLDILDNDL